MAQLKYHLYIYSEQFSPDNFYNHHSCKPHKQMGFAKSLDEELFQAYHLHSIAKLLLLKLTSIHLF